MKTKKQLLIARKRAWKKVERLGACYLDLSKKKQSVLISLCEAIKEANGLDNESYTFGK